MTVKKSAEYHGKKFKQTIKQLDNGSIQISPYGNKAMLRLIAEAIGFDYDESWNTQFFGSKLIDHLNENKSVGENKTTVDNIPQSKEKTMLNITIEGYGREFFAGTVDKETYEYFVDNNIDLTDYVLGDEGVDEPFDFIADGREIYDFDDLWHDYAPSINSEFDVYVNGELLVSDGSFDKLEQVGINMEQDFDSRDVLKALPQPSYIMTGHKGLEKMTYSGEIEIEGDFDPSKLTIYFGFYCGLFMMHKIEYDGIDLEACVSDSTEYEDDEYYDFRSTED